MIDRSNEFEEFPVLRADQPVDAGIGKCAPEGGSDRNRMHDVAKRAEADEKKTRHSWPAIFFSRSREACVFSSPTIAVRPPYAATTPRSGTVSTV